MELQRSESIPTLKNDNNDKYIFVNFDQKNEDQRQTMYEILLLPDRSKHAFVTSSTRLSPPSVPQSVPQSTTMTSGMTAINCASSEADANVSPTRVALSNIQDFVETAVVLRKDKKNELGISIVGGNDTYLESICVQEVHTDSAAHRDGRLRKGDLILAVNDRSLRDISFQDAVRVLREASSPLRLLILRENAQKLFTSHQCPTKFITVELRKGSIKDKLGLSIMQRTNGRGVFITYVQPGSIAAQHGRSIFQGDQILEINGQNVRESNQKDVSQIISNLDGAIVLLLGRVPSLTNSIQEWARKKAHICLRARTSTWSSSSYSGNCLEKLQTQRPSLPVNKEKSYFQTNLLSPESESGIALPFVSINSNISEQENQAIMSRSSSIRSRSRLSIVAENLKIRDSIDGEDNEPECHNGSENPLLPSIKVTEF